MATTYNSINPRTNVYAVKKLLKNMQPEMFIMNLGNATVLPQNSTNVVSFRRYLDFTPILTPLTEGTNNLPNGPTGGVADNYQSTQKEDFQVQMTQHGTYTAITDAVEIFHEDQVFMDAVGRLGVVAGKTIELLGWNVLKAATQVVYSPGATSVATVSAPFTIKTLRNATNLLEKNNANKITSRVDASPMYATSPIPKAYYALAHTDIRDDLYNLNEVAGNNSKSDYFTPYEKYANYQGIMDGEVGHAAQIRFLLSTLYAPDAGAGAVVTDGSVRTTSVGGQQRADVYNIVVLGADAFSTIAVKGLNSAEILVSGDQPSIADPFKTSRTLAWKAWYACVITNPRNLVRIVCASAS